MSFSTLNELMNNCPGLKIDRPWVEVFHHDFRARVVLLLDFFPLPFRS